ncbi:CREB/ATF bZIP transcription factor-like isoform X2 [Daktulosphaira vitifoliae]|uniref:CREB/ATF bZIP transcription factor-like isoform X2 n=1 Tax=Daktulosphaira vitifoliae TaxID=58002 RepID=UPI0021A986E5|nr:CREB/ATF bZIP transcription factor-like isoform X2 [Daktulosphaira vitifoliae]
MDQSSSSSVSSDKYEFSDSDSDNQKPSSSRPRRVPTSNSKNAVAARMNRKKQKEYVKNLEHKMSKLKREINNLKKELDEREKKWVRSRREIAYLRSVIANSPQIGNLLRNIHWRNVIPQQQEERENPVDFPIDLQGFHGDQEWPLNDIIDPSNTELFQDTVPPKHVSMGTTLP